MAFIIENNYETGQQVFVAMNPGINQGINPGITPPRYPKGYFLVLSLFLLTTLIGIAWIGYLIFVCTQVEYYSPLYGSMFISKEKVYASLISLIVTDSLITILQIIATVKQNSGLMGIVVLYRIALFLFYFIRWAMTGSSYGSLFSVWHSIYAFITGEFSERMSKIRK